MKVLSIFLVLFGISTTTFAQEKRAAPICTARDLILNKACDFPQAGTTVTPIFVIPAAQNPDHLALSFILRLCNRLDVVAADITEFTDQTQWLGWNFGVLDTFVYQPESGRDAFKQVYSFGDSGYPCITGRKAEVYLYCNNNGAGCPTGQCFGNFTNSYCICNASYHRTTNPCSAYVSVSIDCPKAYTPSIPNPPPDTDPEKKLNGGEVFGIVVLVLLMVSVFGCVAGYLYNNKVKGLYGADAVPGIRIARELREKVSGDSRYASGVYSRTASEISPTREGYGAL